MILLIDEYDTSILASYENGYYEEFIDFFKVLLAKALKDNQLLEKSVLTGITKVASENYLAEAMKLIYKDNHLRYNFTQKAQNRVKEFEIKKIIKKWEEVIEKEGKVCKS